MIKKNICVLLSLFMLATIGQALAQESPANLNDGIYVIFDASNSMWGELEAGGVRKIEVAKNVLSDFVMGDFSDRDVALRIYGRNRAADCSDTELVIPFGSSSAHLATIGEEVQSSTPRGRTPISSSLTAALADFGNREGAILLISDGIETCDLDPCDLMAQWKDAGIDIRVHVVGFGLDEVARVAMQCVADTSGGGYFDADSADELEVALNQARDAAIAPVAEPVLAGEGDPQVEQSGYALMIIAVDSNGVRYRSAQGEAWLGDDGEAFEIIANGRYPLDLPGTYTLSLGIMMKTGEIYQPVSVQVEVTNRGNTLHTVVVERPPSVSARFVVNQEERSGSLVTAFQNGEEVFSFRSFDEAFAPEGEYEFRASINQDNQLSVNAVLSKGEHRLVNFELINTIRAYLRFQTPDGEEIRRNSELWRNGQQVYRVHGNNGADIAPGEYEIRADNRATPLLATMITIPDEANVVITVPLEAGWIVVTYDPAASYSTAPNRAFLRGVSDPGLNAFASVNTRVMVSPGTWRVEGWSQAGNFDDLDVEVSSGEVVEVMLTPLQQ